MPLPLDHAYRFVAERRKGVLVTIRAEGRPQLSNILYVPGRAAEATAVRISVTEARAKVANLRRDPRGSLYVTSEDFWSYVVLDGAVELSSPAGRPGDEVVDELVEMYRIAQGEHPDWGEFRQAMVDQGRLVATLVATRAYGQIGG